MRTELCPAWEYFPGPTLRALASVRTPQARRECADGLADLIRAVLLHEVLSGMPEVPQALIVVRVNLRHAGLAKPSRSDARRAAA